MVMISAWWTTRSMSAVAVAAFGKMLGHSLKGKLVVRTRRRPDRPPPKGGWMATERLSMRQTREILRQKWRLGRTHREVAQSLGISCGAVGTTVLRARAAGLDWAQVDPLSDEVLQARVYGPRPHPRIIGPFPTAPTCMPSGASPASRRALSTPFARDYSVVRRLATESRLS